MSNDLTRMAKRVKKLPKQLRLRLDHDIEKEMETIARLARANLVSFNTVASGQLGSQTRHMDYSNVSREGSVGFASHAAVANTDYARFVEYGTGFQSQKNYPSPSGPPIGAIEEWIAIKGITPIVYETRSELAEAIAWTIARFGQRPRPFMRPAWKQRRQHLSVAHRRAVRRSLRRL